ncbi:CLUMA_CG004322, isoform A [Clunio marinus]|uniref:CLUMA_CG004322, isoform A n=1 Tax=Clunio marinus TaxID=568069 RepID=A0A1J1HTB1_9DIPT|nr:CLUMA_CG004322, isoform A [Clunio marinus]
MVYKTSKLGSVFEILTLSFKHSTASILSNDISEIDFPAFSFCPKLKNLQNEIETLQRNEYSSEYQRNKYLGLHMDVKSKFEI